MSVEEKYGTFSFSDITFYDKQSFDKVMDEFKKYFGRYISHVDGKRTKGSGKFGLRTAEERDDLRWMDILLDADKKAGTLKVHGYGHRREIFRMIDFMKHYFNSRDIVAYHGSDTAIRNDEMMYGQNEGYILVGSRYTTAAEISDAELMRRRKADWKAGKLPLPDGREQKETQEPDEQEI